MAFVTNVFSGITRGQQINRIDGVTQLYFESTDTTTGIQSLIAGVTDEYIMISKIVLATLNAATLVTLYSATDELIRIPVALDTTVELSFDSFPMNCAQDAALQFSKTVGSSDVYGFIQYYQGINR